MDVRIWDNSGRGINVPMFYFSRQDSSLHVEFPYMSEEDERHAKAQKSAQTD